MTAIASSAEAAKALVLSPREEGRKAQAAEKTRNAVQALETLKRTRQNASAGRKAAAKQKLEALKQRLQQLRMMGATPQQLAQIARELAAAVKAYGASGGSAMEIGVSAAPADAQSVEAAAPEEGETPPEAEAAAKTESDTAEEPKDQKAETPYDKAIRALQADSAQQARRSAEAQEDRDFLAEARMLARALKAAAVEAERRAAFTGDPSEADVAQAAAAQAEQAVAEAEAALQDAGGAVAGVAITV